ncbi:LOW QUALITY PROTEIN: adenylate kinase-like kinase [Mycobacterium sp. JS623]|nr:LOW QUALITY PROTEIN: adenylate kinase-like kinase [Mycobacterium sp. JS623]
MRAILIGPPGSGKSTQAYMLATKFAIPHIAPEQLIRESISVGSRLGVAANHYLETGDPVPSNVMNALMADRISQIDCLRRGFILDGYPRLLEQAVRLTRSLGPRDTTIDAVLHLQVPDTELLARAKNSARADGTDETIQSRLHMYRMRAAPLLDYYAHNLVPVDGAGSVDEVFTRVLQALGR